MYKGPCEKDCPRRTGVCKITCETWQEYEKKHFEELKERQKKIEAQEDYMSFYAGAVKRSKSNQKSRKGAWWRS
jgi:hypothetical protein